VIATHTPDKPDPKRFWLIMAASLACSVIGATLAWLDYAATQATEERAGWVSGEAQLLEVGILWSAARSGANYTLIARYVLRVDGRDYEGSEIANDHSSASPQEVRSQIARFAPEALEFNLQDLGELNPQRTWHVMYRPVPARYDPRDPAQSQMLLENSTLIDIVPRWFLRGIIVCILLAGVVLLVFARRAVRGSKQANS
jgi:hypothetical protein